MTSPARKLRRAQQRQMLKGMRAAMRQAPTPPQPGPAERAADRMAELGVLHSKSLLWTPPEAR